MAQSSSIYKPTKAGGGGSLKILLWQAPTLLNPHFARGTKDQVLAHLLRAAGGMGQGRQPRPVLDARSRPQNGGLAADGKA